LFPNSCVQYSQQQFHLEQLEKEAFELARDDNFADVDDSTEEDEGENTDGDNG
jgi:hypothetical protein